MTIRIERADADQPDIVTVDCRADWTNEEFAAMLRLVCPGGYAELVAVTPDPELSIDAPVETDSLTPCAVAVDEDMPFLHHLESRGVIWIEPYRSITLRPLAAGDRIVIEAD